jgi:hypothetical protein
VELPCAPLVKCQTEPGTLGGQSRARSAEHSAEAALRAEAVTGG